MLVPHVPRAPPRRVQTGVRSPPRPRGVRRLPEDAGGELRRGRRRPGDARPRRARPLPRQPQRAWAQVGGSRRRRRPLVAGVRMDRDGHRAAAQEPRRHPRGGGTAARRPARHPRAPHRRRLDRRRPERHGAGVRVLRRAVRAAGQRPGADQGAPLRVHRDRMARVRRGDATRRGPLRGARARRQAGAQRPRRPPPDRPRPRGVRVLHRGHVERLPPRPERHRRRRRRRAPGLQRALLDRGNPPQDGLPLPRHP